MLLWLNRFGSGAQVLSQAAPGIAERCDELGDGIAAVFGRASACRLGLVGDLEAV
jgi:hypothetical protein